MAEIQERARSIPIIHEADVCVLGGSCTGVFAALRAARLGAKVVLVEKAGCFGGVATLSLVNVWHNPLDTEFQKQIIGGLTIETMDRLRRRNAVRDRAKSHAWAWAFNPFELMIELDEMVQEAKVVPMLHTMFVAAHASEPGRVEAVIVENKSGRGAIKAKVFVDATGDGDLCQRLGLETYVAAHFQPSTTCAILEGWDKLDHAARARLMLEHGEEFGLKRGFAWDAPIEGSDLCMLAGTRVTHANCAEAEALTRAEMEGRRQVRAILDLLRKYVPEQRVNLLGLPARIGIRETRHVRCEWQITGADVLSGRRYDDAIANGSYRVDVHFQDQPGILFKYLDGTQQMVEPGVPHEKSRWRPETARNPTFYQIPFRAMLPRGNIENVVVAGRMIDADSEAHAAIRVMVNMNQTGEAAGVAAVLALEEKRSMRGIDPAKLRAVLAQGASVVL